MSFGPSFSFFPFFFLFWFIQFRLCTHTCSRVTDQLKKTAKDFICLNKWEKKKKKKIKKNWRWYGQVVQTLESGSRGCRFKPQFNFTCLNKQERKKNRKSNRTGNDMAKLFKHWTQDPEIAGSNLSSGSHFLTSLLHIKVADPASSPLDQDENKNRSHKLQACVHWMIPLQWETQTKS